MTRPECHPCPRGQRPLTQAEATLVHSGVSVSQLLPLESPDGPILETLTLHCATCKAAIADDDTRARVTPWAAHHNIRAIGICRDCEHSTTLNLRWMNDGSIVGRHPGTGEWAQWNCGGARAWWDVAGRIIDALRRWLIPAS